MINGNLSKPFHAAGLGPLTKNLEVKTFLWDFSIFNSIDGKTFQDLILDKKDNPETWSFQFIIGLQLKQSNFICFPF